MIKKDYLSEVEALYVQREALHSEDDIPRLFVVWAEVGQSVHGFVAARESIDEHRVVRFTPVTDIVVLQNHVRRVDDLEFVVDYRKRAPEDLMWMIVGKAQWKDEDEICGEVPTMGEDVTTI